MMYYLCYAQLLRLIHTLNNSTTLRAAFLDTLLTSHPPKRGSSCRVLSPRSSDWSRLLNRFRCAITITFCQSWSTLVSLESAFNAEQEYDIIFAVTCTTKEIKIQNEVHDRGVIQATVEADSDITLGPVGCKGVHV